MRLGCVVLASGRGKRFSAFGGVGNKLLASVAGKPLVCRTVASVPGDAYGVVVSTRWPEVSATVEGAGLPAEVVLHESELRSDSIRAGLGRGMDRWDGCLFLPGDQPLVSCESFCALASAFVADPSRAYRLSWGGAPGSPVLFPASAFDALMALEGNRGGGSQLLDGSVPCSLIPAVHEHELWDVDTPDALSRIETVLLR